MSAAGGGNEHNDHSDHEDEERDPSDFCYFDSDCHKCYRGGGHKCVVRACGCADCRELAKHHLERAIRQLEKAVRDGYSDDYGGSDGEDNTAEVKAAAIARVKQARDNLTRELDAYLASL